VFFQVSQQLIVLGMEQDERGQSPLAKHGSCVISAAQEPGPYNSPVSGLCCDRFGLLGGACGGVSSAQASPAVSSRQVQLNAVFGTGSGTPQQVLPCSLSSRPDLTGRSMSWMPAKTTPVASSTCSMPELWDGSERHGSAYSMHIPPVTSEDKQLLRDQGLLAHDSHAFSCNNSPEVASVQRSAAHSAPPWQQQWRLATQRNQSCSPLPASPSASTASSSAQQQPQQHQQPQAQQASSPLGLLLSPLLPSADERNLLSV